jgi:uncharacterized protein (TIGR02611 family)
MRKPEWITSATTYWQSFPKPIRKVLAASVGVVTLAVGVALLVLPGPGIAVVLLGLAILATEFAWARRSLHHAKRHGSRVTQKVARARGSITAKRGRNNDA